MNWEALKAQAAGHVRAHLGEDVRFHLAEGQTVPLRAVFTIADVEVGMGGEVSIDSRQPMCSVLRVDMPRKPRQGDTITRRDITYEVVQVPGSSDTAFDLLLHVIDARQARSTRQLT